MMKLEWWDLIFLAIIAAAIFLFIMSILNIPQAEFQMKTIVEQCLDNRSVETFLSCLDIKGYVVSAR